MKALAPIPEGEDEAPETEEPSSTTSGSSTDPKLKGWEAIPKPKGHSGLDYSRWDSLAGDISDGDDDDDDSDDDDSSPQFKFRLRTVGVRSIDK